jgi:hypothetical protein
MTKLVLDHLFISGIRLRRRVNFLPLAALVPLSIFWPASAQAHDSALTTASVEMKWINGWSAAATFEGEFSNVTSSYAGKGVVRYAW